MVTVARASKVDSRYGRYLCESRLQNSNVPIISWQLYQLAVFQKAVTGTSALASQTYRTNKVGKCNKN